MELVPILCVDIVIRNEHSQVLLVKRANEPLKGEWYLPGGRVLRKESVSTAATRKAREELGVSLVDPKYIGYYEDFFETSSMGVSLHNVILVFQGEMIGTPRLDSQSTAWKWGPMPQRVNLGHSGSTALS